MIVRDKSAIQSGVFLHPLLSVLGWCDWRNNNTRSNCSQYFINLVLKSQDKNPDHNQTSSKARPDIRNVSRDYGLHTISKDQLQGPEGGHKVGRDELECLGHGGEGQQTRHSKSSENEPV